MKQNLISSLQFSNEMQQVKGHEAGPQLLQWWSNITLINITVCTVTINTLISSVLLVWLWHDHLLQESLQPSKQLPNQGPVRRQVILGSTLQLRGRGGKTGGVQQGSRQVTVVVLSVGGTFTQVQFWGNCTSLNSVPFTPLHVSKR